MARPDTHTPEGLTAYRAELRTVARGWRWTGLSLVALAVVGLYLTAIWDLGWGSPLGVATIAGLAVGWGLAIVGVVKRARYHRHRMQG
jgi:hypothetical protein